jgi:predicted GNAT family acetyltransferase
MKDVVRNEAKQRFEMQLDDGAVAFSDYRLTDGKVTFPHTVVPPHHEGQGIGSALAKASLDWARGEGLKVVPVCSFYAKYMARHAEVHDLLAPGVAEQLGL